MTAYDAEDLYLTHINQPYGKRYAETVGRFQEGFLKDRVCKTLDDAFARAVEVTEKLAPVLKLAV